jgi:hypothetical protein
MDFGLRANMNAVLPRVDRGLRLVCLAAAVALVGGHLPGASSTSDAAVTLGGPPSGASLYSIEFEQFNQVNPTYTFTDVPQAGTLTVSFGTHFAGQTLSSTPNALADTTPSGNLALDHSGPAVSKTLFDLSRPTGPVLGSATGNMLFTSPLAILFDHAVNFVSFDLGHLDPGSPTMVQAFGSEGQSLGVFSGFPSGHSLVSLAESTGANVIGGISVYLPEDEMDWEGFALSDVSFGIGEGESPVIPEPATVVVWSMLGTLAMGVAVYQRRRSGSK